MQIQISRRSLIVCIISVLLVCLIGLVLFKCLRSETHRLDQNDCKCKGIEHRIKSRVINGTFVEKGDLPWVVSIFVKLLKFVNVKGWFVLSCENVGILFIFLLY